jgi:hypothetical protein
MKKIIFIYLITIMGCKQPPLVDKIFRIKVTTTSNDSLVCYLEYHVNGIHYPDTSLPIIKPQKQVVKNNKAFYIDRGNPWEDYIATLPADTLSVFFFRC